jgi:hypothetical protein
MKKAEARAQDPFIVIEGIEEITKRDLAKHRALIEQTQAEMDSFRAARAHEIRRKKHYRKQIGGGKFDDDALRRAMKDIAVNIRHMSDKCQAAEEKLKHHKLIVDTLSAQLEVQEKLLRKIRLLRGE